MAGLNEPAPFVIPPVYIQSIITLANEAQDAYWSEDAGSYKGRLQNAMVQLFDIFDSLRAKEEDEPEV